MKQSPLSEIQQVNSPNTPVSVVGRVSAILRVVGAAGDGGIRLMDLASHTGLPRPTVHRLLRELSTEGLVQQAPDKKYCLGPALWHLSSSAASPIPNLPQVKELARELAEHTGDTVYLAINSLGRSRYLFRASGSHPLRGERVDIGERLPFTTTYNGLVLLGLQPPAVQAAELERVANDRAEKWFEMTPRRHRDKLADALSAFRDTGFITGPHLVLPGLNGLATPIPSSVSQLSVSISADIHRLPERRAVELMPVLKATAEEMAALVGL